MKHDDVVAAIKVIAEKGMAINISKVDLQDLKKYNLIDIAKGEEDKRSPACTLTKKGRVMLKANLPKADKVETAEEEDITD
jgi:DNA-binding MarR family transcriptional regulator